MQKGRAARDKTKEVQSGGRKEMVITNNEVSSRQRVGRRRWLRKVTMISFLCHKFDVIMEYSITMSIKELEKWN